VDAQFFLQGAPIAEKSKIQQSTTLSVTEAELNSGVEYVQDMLFAMRVLESIGLRVQKPMMIKIQRRSRGLCQQLVFQRHNETFMYQA
jgi:hypothetical protein